MATDDATAALQAHVAAFNDRDVRAPIAGFYTVRDGLMASVKIYCEGSADIPDGGGA